MAHNDRLMSEILATVQRVGRLDVVVEAVANGMVSLYAWDGHWIGPFHSARYLLDRISDADGAGASFWDHLPSRRDDEMLLLWIGNGADILVGEVEARAILEPGLPLGSNTRRGRDVGEVVVRLVHAMNACIQKGWATGRPPGGVVITNNYRYLPTKEGRQYVIELDAAVGR